ncbi:MAG: histidine kinase [Chitinophagaceae bacterium]|nr:histidine kinase [Chitinophagaceae bacterium]
MARQYLLIIFLFPASHLFGQQLTENYFDHYTIASGMSDNTVTGIAQDARGYVWIATAAGLNRYNGSRFVQFHSNDDSLSLPAENIARLTWLDQHRLAALTVGLHIIDTKTGSTRNLFIPYHKLQYQFKFNMIQRVIGDANGHLYILSRSGFYHYDENYTLLSRFDYYSEEEVPVEHFYWGRELFELDSSRLLITSNDGFYVYDKGKKKVTKMTADDCPILAELLPGANTYYSFFQPKRGHFFIHKIDTDSLFYFNTIENKKTVSKLPFKPARTEFNWRSRLITVSDTTFYLTSHQSGFFKVRFYPSSGAIQLYPEKYFDSYVCTSLLKDKENNLWITTNRGLFRQNLPKSQVQTAMLPSGMDVEYPDTKVDDIYVSSDKIYAGIRGGGGLFLFNKKTLQPGRQVLHKKNATANHIRAIIPVDGSTLLLGTNGPLLLFNRNSERLTEIIPPKWDYKSDWTNDIYKDLQGKIWISANFIYRYDPKSKIFKVFPNHPRLLSVPIAIEEDTAGNIWMSGHALARYNTTLDSFDLVLDSFPYIKMPDKQINSLVIDNKNRVWFNSYNNGLAAYDINTRKFRHFTRGDGLPGNDIASMTIVGNKLWLACYSGIACMDLETFRIVSFGKDDGFPDMPVIRGAKFFYDRELQQLYIGFSTAFVRFNPHEILRRKLPPQIFVESLIIGGHKNIFLPDKQITTSWDDNEIRMTIGAINFSDGNSQRFAYRILKKNNTEWMQIGSQPSFNISNLSPGTHYVQVKAYSPNNRWPEQVHEMSIIVLPPLWQKDWFIVTMLALVLLLVFSLIKWRIGSVRKKEMEKTNLQKLKADHYKNQFELEQISNYFSSSLTSKKTEEEVLWDVTENLIGRMNYEDCIIYLWNDDQTKMVQKAAFGPKGKPEVISTQVFDVLPGQGIVGHVIQSLQPILLNDTRVDKRYRVDDEFRLSELCVPIIHNDELLGIIDSEHHLPNYFSERDIKILTTIATLIGNKLKQIESEQSLDAKRKELANINEQLAEARLSALQSQMNPHFVFNALNSIKWMILDGDNEKASRYLSKFALMIRMTLDHSKEVFVTLAENIQYLRTYLEMEQLRFDDSFTYSIYISKNIDVAETTIPSMMIQPLVENAIWHGLMQAEAEKKILISFTQDANMITCTVEDNGIGIHRSEKSKEKTRPPHKSVGLENLQKRVNIINEKYDMNCSLVISDLKESGKKASGTSVVLQFNLINV